MEQLEFEKYNNKKHKMKWKNKWKKNRIIKNKLNINEKIK